MTRAIVLNDDLISLPAQRTAIRAALDAAARAVKQEFEKTTNTWQHQPVFAVTEPSEFHREITTDDEIYGYVNDGTRPHLIVAHGQALAFNVGGTPKTAPRVVGSGTGSRGGQKVVVHGPVHHPGTEAREFDEAIADEIEPKLADIVQRAIDGATP